jgi:tRNA/rRNA methyltransferase
MNQPQINTNLFKQLRFILVETSRAGNIGAVARAMKTMGYSDLVLVNPRFDERAAGPRGGGLSPAAPRISWKGARVVGRWPRRWKASISPPPCRPGCANSRRRCWTPREMAGQLANQPALHAALIFGNERFGLPNELVEKCNVLINIPANPDYSSLNLSQAAQVLAYECRMALLDRRRDPQRAPAGRRRQRHRFPRRGRQPGADRGHVPHLEQALVEIGFLDAGNPRKLMPRLKRLFSRAQLESEEVNILRGIARHMVGKRKA